MIGEIVSLGFLSNFIIEFSYNNNFNFFLGLAYGKNTCKTIEKNCFYKRNFKLLTS